VDYGTFDNMRAKLHISKYPLSYDLSVYRSNVMKIANIHEDIVNFWKDSLNKVSELNLENYNIYLVNTTTGEFHPKNTTYTIIFG